MGLRINLRDLASKLHVSGGEGFEFADQAAPRAASHCLKGPILIHRLDSPLEFLSKSLRKELLDGHIELLAEDNRQTGIDVVLQATKSVIIEQR